MAKIQPTELTVTVNLSPEDRELLRRIADRLDASADAGADASFGDSARRLTEVAPSTGITGGRVQPVTGRYITVNQPEDFPPEFEADRSMLKDI